MQGRWNIENTRKATNLKEFILTRWHYKPGSIRTALARNAFSRLWWAAELTHAPWEKDQKFNCFKTDDPYKYTKILTSSSQLIQDILDRKWGSNLLFRICFLEAFSRIMNKKEISKTKLSSKLSIIFRACLIPDFILLAE